MAAQPPDPEIEKLLAELGSDDAGRRNAALDKIAERKVQNAEISAVIKTLAQTDPDATVRYRADQTLMVIGAAELTLVPKAPGVSSPAKPIKPLSRRAKIVQFTIGFLGWFAPNWALAGFPTTLPEPGPFTTEWFYVGLCQGPFTLGVLIVLLVFKRWWVALGLLTALAVNWFLASTLVPYATTFWWFLLPFVPFFIIPR